MDQVGLYLGYVKATMEALGVLEIIQSALGASVVIGIIFVVVKGIRQA